MARSWRRYSAPSSGVRMSGSLTISIRGTPQRLKSTRLDSASSMIPAWTSLPVSSSRCTRRMPTRFVSPPTVNVIQPCSDRGSSYWEIW